jgi:hypothetical protein
MWNPPIALTSEEQKIAARTRKTRKFFVFLREHRHELLDADFQHILAQSYSPEPSGQEPVDAGLLALATLLQAYCHVGDRDAVELTVMDKRWQLVLDCLGAEHPPFSQGTLFNFRMRLIAHNLDKTLLDRTVALAEKTGGFGARQLRAVLDSTPLFGAGRVEDTLNLLGHALRKAVGLAAQDLGTSAPAVVAAAGLTLVGHSSLKAALDLDWGEPGRAPTRWAWSWRRWHGGNTGWNSNTPWRPRPLLSRRSWRPSPRLSRRIRNPTLTGSRGGGASSRTSPLTGASRSRIKIYATAAKAARKPSTASRSTLR